MTPAVDPVGHLAAQILYGAMIAWYVLLGVVHLVRRQDGRGRNRPHVH